MQKNPFRPSFPCGPAALSLMLVGVMLCGCGKKAKPTAVQDEVDFADAANLFSVPLSPQAASRPSPDTVMARVNGEPITFGAVEKEVNVLLLANRSSGSLTPERMRQMRSRLGDQALQNVIVKRLLAGAVEEENVEASQEEIDEQLSVVSSNLPDGTSIEELLERNRLTHDELVTDLALSLRVQKLLEAKTSDIKEPTAEEVAAYYAENPDQFARPATVNLRHLLIRGDGTNDPSAQPSAQERIAMLRQQIVDGAAFADLAKQHSDDTPSRERGGLIEDVQRAALPAALGDAAFQLETGQVSDVLETQLGYHLILVEHREPTSTFAIEDVADQISAKLLQAKKKQALDAYVETLKQKAAIEIPQALPGAGAASDPAKS